MIAKKCCEVMSYPSVQHSKQNPHGIARMRFPRLRNLHKNISRPHKIEISKHSTILIGILQPNRPGWGTHTFLPYNERLAPIDIDCFWFEIEYII